MTLQTNHHALILPQTFARDGAPTDDNDGTDFAAITDTSTLPQPVLPPIQHATYKAQNADFVVNEVLELDFTGDGEHLWLHVQKSGVNTAYLAKLLSEWADIPLRDVGYSGLKDRQACTTQWFSLRIPKKILPEASFAPVDLNANESIQILDLRWHNKKLNRGTHPANQFTITLRAVQFADDVSVTEHQQRVEQHLQSMAQTGVPNYFGPQRFGYAGNNIKEALHLFAKEIPKKSDSSPKNKRKRPAREQNAMKLMPLSAARSLIFNEILAARVRDKSWNTGLAGEVFNLDGSGSIFATEQMDETLRARLNSGDIHPTAVMWGTGNDKVTGTAAHLESKVVQENKILRALAKGLERHDIKAQRRALRLPVEGLTWQWADEHTLILSFTLTTGSFATSVLASLVQHLQST